MQLLTPPGRGGIAVVRAPSAERHLLLALLRRVDGSPLVLRGDAGPVRARLQLPGPIDDDVLVVDRGENGLEVHLHGSPVLLRLFAEVVGGFAAREPSAAEALLQVALSRAQVELAIEQSGRDFAACCRRILAMPRPALEAEVRAAVERTRVARALASPVRIVIAGRQNAGKSTLFNRLLFRERSLSGPHAGLTRDSVEEATELAGYPVDLVDTAGEGEVETLVDAEALLRSRTERERAGVLLLAVDRGVGPAPIDRELLGGNPFVVATKGDLVPGPWPSDFPVHVVVSGLEPASSPRIRQEVGEALARFRGLPPAGPVGGPAALDPLELTALFELASACGIAPA